MNSNPITAALGHTVPVQDGHKTLIHITVGNKVLQGAPCDPARNKMEAFYLVTPSGMTEGAAVAAPSGMDNPAKALTIFLASRLAGPNPKAGEVARWRERLSKAQVSFSFKPI